MIVVLVILAPQLHTLHNLCDSLLFARSFSQMQKLTHFLTPCHTQVSETSDMLWKMTEMYEKMSHIAYIGSLDYIISLYNLWIIFA